MGKYVSKHSFPMAHPANPDKQILVRAGEVFEMDDADAQGGLENNTLRRIDDEDAEIGTVVEIPEPVQLPARPTNAATKDTWFNYLDDLEDATSELGELEVSDDAKRDDLIAIGDARVAAWNARQGV